MFIKIVFIVRFLNVFSYYSVFLGYPHRMRFKAFNARYRLLAPFSKLRRSEEKTTEDCRLILQCLDENHNLKQPVSQVSTSWAFGKRHIFLRCVTMNSFIEVTILEFSNGKVFMQF